MSQLISEDSVSEIKGVGPALREKLERLGIFTIGDLLKHFPRTYLDFSKQILIKDLKNKEPASFLARISLPKTFYSSSGRLITQAIAEDRSGKITLTWFNNPYIKRLVREGTLYSIAGKPSFFGHGLTLVSPMIEEGDSFSINTQGLVPVYPQTEGVTSRWLRKKIFDTLLEISIIDPLDNHFLSDNNFLTLKDALQKIHFPATAPERWQADKRLSFNEHLRINLINRLEQKKLGQSVSIKINPQLDQKIIQRLPFSLTRGQEKTLKQIKKDLVNPEFTHRLIQGETGSGKTAPLLFAANLCLASGHSCALLAPTEILATQHFHTFTQYLDPSQNIQLITSGTNTKITPSPTLFIGTHALLNQLSPTLKPALAFLAIDEQHKFGVAQRELLLQRRPLPHLFNLSATPIPRTVALGLLGDIEISNIALKPSQRLPVKTFVVSPTKYKNSPQWLIKKLEEGNQIFVVCPNISDHALGVSSVEVQTKNYRRLLPKKFPILSLHGQLTSDHQQRVLNEFKNTPGAVLVSTSLIEVGIDIPTANVMVIHSAERFGLAQLHQLRGRVGRGNEQGFCFLVPTSDDEIETERLQLLQKFHNGLVLAQKDLRLRGAGEITGEKQHGSLQTRLKYFWSRKLFLSAKSLSSKIIKESRQNAQEIASRLHTW